MYVVVEGKWRKVRRGTAIDVLPHVGVQRLEDLTAFQLSVDFKLEVYRLINESSGARADWRYRAQLTDSAAGVESCIAEGWHRFVAAEFVNFLRYSRASLAEAERWLKDGVARGHFAPYAIDIALEQANRCGGAITNLRKSLEPFRKKSSARRRT